MSDQRITEMREQIAFHRDHLRGMHQPFGSITYQELSDLLAQHDALKAQIETLRTALEQKTRWADFLATYLDENHDAHGSDAAWDAFVMKEHETLPVVGCECVRCRAALAPRPAESPK